MVADDGQMDDSWRVAITAAGFGPRNFGKPDGGEERGGASGREEDIAIDVAQRCLDDGSADPMTPMCRQNDNRPQQTIAGAAFEAGISDRLAVA